MDATLARIGNYDLLHQLDATALYQSYLAKDSRSDQQVTLKVLQPALYHDESVRGQFIAAGHTARSLIHQHIVRVLDAGDIDGRAFVAEEYLDTVSLSSLLADRKEPVNAEELAAIVPQLAAALDYAHQQRILHLQLSPDHILVTATGELLIEDFGLPTLRVDETGTALRCTPYTAPERLVKGQQPTAATDVYALGAICYHLMTGQPPFSLASNLPLWQQIVEKQPESVARLNPQISPVIDHVVATAMSKRPEERHRSAKTLANQLVESVVIWRTGSTASAHSVVAFPNIATESHDIVAAAGYDPSYVLEELDEDEPQRRRWPLVVLPLLLAGLGLWQLFANPAVNNRALSLARPVLERAGIDRPADLSTGSAAVAGLTGQDAAPTNLTPEASPSPLPAAGSAAVAAVPPTATSSPTPTSSPAVEPSPTAAPTSTVQPLAAAVAAALTLQTTATVENDPTPAAAEEASVPVEDKTATDTEISAADAGQTATSEPTATATAEPTATATAEPTAATVQDAQPSAGPVDLLVEIADLERGLAAGDTVLNGRAPVGSRVDILNEGRIAASAQVDSSGHWSVLMPFRTAGPYTFAVQNIDSAGRAGPSFGPVTVTIPAAAVADQPSAVAAAPRQAEATRPATPAKATASATPTPPKATIARAAATPVPPTPTPTPARPRPTATSALVRRTAPPTAVRASSAAQPVYVGSVKLLSPDDQVGGSGRLVFSWEADFTPPPGTAFELVFFPRNRDPMAEGFGLAAPTLNTSESIDLDALDISLGNLLQPGDYQWGLLLVQRSPYRRIAFLGDQHEFRFNRTYGDGKPNVENAGD